MTTKSLQKSERWNELSSRSKNSFLAFDEPGFPFSAGFPEQVFDSANAALIFEIIDFRGRRFLASRDGLSVFEPTPVWRVWKPTWGRKEFLEAIFVVAWREVASSSQPHHF